MAKPIKIVKSSQISDRMYIKHALMFIFADVFSNYVREFEKEVKNSGMQFRHEVKYHYNNYLQAVERAKKEASLFMEGMLTQSPDSVVDNLFSDSDSFNLLFKMILDRVVGEKSDKDVFRRIYAFVHQTFQSSHLFPELEDEVSVMQRFRQGLCCDMVDSCPLSKSIKEDANGYQYSVFYCRGMFKNCARRKIRVVKGMKAVPVTLLPDGTNLPEGESVFKL